MKNKRATLSVIVPAHNEEDHLHDCLEALVQQKEFIDEIIVVNNNSSDETEKIAQSFRSVTLLQEEKQGLPFARNRGLNAASSELLARIDADAVVAPGWAREIHRVMSDNKLVGATGPTRLHSIPLPEVNAAVFNFYLKYIIPLIGGSRMLWGSNMVFRRDAWLKIKGNVNNNDKFVWEDLNLSLLLKDHGSIAFNDAQVVTIFPKIAYYSFKHQFEYYKRWPQSYREFSSWAETKAWVCVYSLAIFFWLPSQASMAAYRLFRRLYSDSR